MKLIGSLLLAFLLASCVGVSAQEPTHWVELAGQRYRVELAADDHSRMRGLMFRESMAADAGMLFVFDREHPQSFWMKNTLLALDILYFDRAGRLVSVSARTPPCRTAYCPSYPSAGPAQFVLELNAGETERLDLQTGTRLHFGPGIPGVPLDR
jgi:uncharacterized membrane protein (UPF0127 family)